LVALQLATNVFVPEDIEMYDSEAKAAEVAAEMAGNSYARRSE
jgi:hypothetical protein